MFNAIDTQANLILHSARHAACSRNEDEYKRSTEAILEWAEMIRDGIMLWKKDNTTTHGSHADKRTET